MCLGLSNLKFRIKGIHPHSLSTPMMHIEYSPYFSKIYKFPSNFILICFLASPYSDHDACTHHALHVLDGPNQEILNLWLTKQVLNQSVSNIWIQYNWTNYHSSEETAEETWQQSRPLVRKLTLMTVRRKPSLSEELCSETLDSTTPMEDSLKQAETFITKIRRWTKPRILYMHDARF